MPLKYLPRLLMERNVIEYGKIIHSQEIIYNHNNDRKIITSMLLVSSLYNMYSGNIYDGLFTIVLIPILWSGTTQQYIDIEKVMPVATKFEYIPEYVGA